MGSEFLIIVGCRPTHTIWLDTADDQKRCMPSKVTFQLCASACLCVGLFCWRNVSSART